MLNQYIQAAMRKAKYEILADSGEFYGEIAGFQGVWASASTLEQCREELSDALEAWLLFSISRGMKVPVVGRHKLVTDFASAYTT